MDESGVQTEQALGKALQQARKQAGMTQQQLCQQAELSYSTLAKIERGAIKSPSVFTIQRIAAILGISMDGLLGATVDTTSSNSVQKAKKTSKTGISFLFMDVNGCLVRFFHGAFSKLAAETGLSSDAIETTFWHYNDAVCRGEMNMQEFNTRFAERLAIEPVNWIDYYLDAVEPITEMHDTLVWAAQHYRVGLLTNIMPGFIDAMRERKLLPDVAYDAIIDSSREGVIKPEEAIYIKAQDKANVAANEILFVDDSRTNLMAAEHLGWRVMWFDDYRPEESVQKIRESLAF